MATIRAASNKHGNYVIYVGREKFPMGDSLTVVKIKMAELRDSGHKVSDRLEVTNADIDPFSERPFSA